MWWALGVIAVMAMGFTWCVVEDQREKSEEMVGPVTVATTATPPAPAAAAPLAAAPAAPPRAPLVIAQTVELPKRKIDAAKVLGKDAAGVARLLGRGERSQPGMVYGGFDGVLVRVEFERGRAALISITARGYSNTEVDREAVLAWAGASMTDEMTWRLDRVGTTIEVWNRDAKTRSDERRRVAGAVGHFLSRVGIGSGFARGEVNTSFLVNQRAKGCTTSDLRAFVADVRKELRADLAKLGFLEVQCGMDGPRISLR